MHAAASTTAAQGRPGTSALSATGGARARSSGISRGARREPSWREPAAEKCRPSSSQSLLSSEKGTRALVSTKSSTPSALPDPCAQSWSMAFSCRQLARCFGDRDVLLFGGTERTTVRTPALWQAACMAWMFAAIAAGDWRPRSLVPAMINARLNGPCSDRACRRPSPLRPTKSQMLATSMHSDIFFAVIPLRPQTQISAAASPRRCLTSVSAYGAKWMPLLWKPAVRLSP
mmetsp:Transcript_6893/g.21018  ORF Transcript_6893/g.21018 Transcript_6893/m.21018 type:complete len:231 (-) Transcript_6893:341-1033(-)